MKALCTLALLALSGPLGIACECRESKECARLGNGAYPTFVGTVMTVQEVSVPTRSPGPPLHKRKRVRIRIDESFGGVAQGVEINIYTGLGGGDCGIPFQSREVYLVHGSKDTDGVIYTGLCSGTRKLDHAGASLLVLRLLHEGKPAPSLAGRIALAGKPIANTVVHVKSETVERAMRSDHLGAFAFYGLPVGTYEYWIDPAADNRRTVEVGEYCRAMRIEVPSR